MKKLLCLFSGLILNGLPVSVSAQKRVADSLQIYLRQLPAPPDTHYVLTQCRIAGAQLAFNLRLSDSTARQAQKTARQISFPSGEVVALNLLGVAAQRQDRYAEAVTYYLPAIQLAKSVRDTIRWARTLNNLGLAYFYVNDYAYALRAFGQATVLQHNPLEQCRLLNNIGLVYKNQEKPDSALHYFHRSLALSVSLKNEQGMASSYSNIGQIHLNRGDVQTAERFYRQALDVDREAGNQNGEAISTTNIGVALARQRHYREAVAYLSAGFRQSGEQGNRSNQHYAAENLYQLYEQQGNIDSAYWWHKQFHALQDSLARAEQTEKLAEISNRYAHDQQLREVEQNLANEQQRRWLWLGGTVLLLILLVLTLFAYWQVRRRRVIEERLQDEEIARLRAEQVIQSQRQTELQTSIADRDRVMASQSIHLLQKNELLGRVSDQLQEAVGGNGATERLRPLLKLLQTSAHTDEQWETFKRQFEAVHGVFFQRLLTQQPRLTAHDLRYCAYLRMNLTSKEIASLLNTSLRSVETHRYRLRRKLDLPTEQDLVGWLMQV